MKTRICLVIAIVLLSYSISNSKDVAAVKNPSQEGSINVFTSPDLYNLTLKWVNEYGLLNPTLKIKVIKTENNNVSGMLHSDGGIGFIGNESWTTSNNQSMWNMIVGRDIIVPIMNKKNLFRDQIILKGITSKGLMRILETPEKQNWGMMIGNPENIQDIPLHCFIVNDPSILSGVENFLNTKSLNGTGIKKISEQEMISAIQKDPNAMGFCKLIQITDNNNQSLAENIQLVPIDKNGNGKVDYMENIYYNLQEFSRGVWIGKYPQSLSGKIYAVSSEKPKSEKELAFLSWVLTDGQKFLNVNGFNDLVFNERQTQLAKINEPSNFAPSPTKDTYPLLKMILLAVLAFGVIVFMWDLLVRRSRTKKSSVSTANLNGLTLFDENSIIIPKGIYFDKTHTWAFMKRDGTVKIGMNSILQHVTGHITRIELKKTGSKIKKGEQLLSIVQKGKQLEIYSPISGTIKVQNESILNNPSLLNTAPFDYGWIYTLEPTNWLLEIQYLSMAEKYKMGLKNEFTRLKDFFATAVKSDAPEYALITLQDGGALKDNILEDLGPEVWDDFQTKFVDVAR